MSKRGRNTEPVTADAVLLIIKRAGFKLNEYAAAYAGALHRAEAEYGEEGVRTQILYILSNLRAYGTEQQAAKKRLVELSKGSKA